METNNETTIVNDPPKTDPTKEIEQFLSGYKETLNVEGEPPPSEEPKKKKRGRPRKNPVPEPEPQLDTIQDSNLLSGALLLLMVDLFIPNILVFINNKVSKDKSKKMKASTLQMTNQQRKELEPIADEVSRQLMVHASPMAVFIFSMMGIYGLNFLMQKGD